VGRSLFAIAHRCLLPARVAQLGVLYDGLCERLQRRDDTLAVGVTRATLVECWYKGCVAMMVPAVFVPALLPDDVADDTTLASVVEAHGRAFGVTIRPGDTESKSDGATSSESAGFTLTREEYAGVLALHGDYFTLGTTVGELRRHASGVAIAPDLRRLQGTARAAAAAVVGAAAPAADASRAAFADVRAMIRGTGRRTWATVSQAHAANRGDAVEAAAAGVVTGTPAGELQPVGDAPGGARDTYATTQLLVGQRDSSLTTTDAIVKANSTVYAVARSLALSLSPSLALSLSPSLALPPSLSLSLYPSPLRTPVSVSFCRAQVHNRCKPWRAVHRRGCSGPTRDKASWRPR
jgi:hypothetical protein